MVFEECTLLETSTAYCLPQRRYVSYASRRMECERNALTAESSCSEGSIFNYLKVSMSPPESSRYLLRLVSADQGDIGRPLSLAFTSSEV